MAQLKQTTISGDLTVNGNTYFNSPEQTRQEVNFIGYDPDIANTPAAWFAAGTGTAFVNSGNTIGLSGYKGFVENKVNGSGTIYQTFHAISPVDIFYRRGYTSSGEWSGWSRIVNTDYTNKELWSGSWKSGTITVPNTADYSLFKIQMDGQGTTVLGIRYGEHVRGIGGYAGDADEATIYQFTATYSGNTWTFKQCHSFKHNVSSSHGSATARTVSSIRGVV